MIEIQELTFKYKNAKSNALQDISLKIEDGDFIGIIGESGAGKTTFCSVLNGLIPHHYDGDFYGSVKVNGTDTFDTKPDKLALKVGSVFQDIESQIISQFVEEEILFGLENFGVPADQIEQRIVSALDTLGKRQDDSFGRNQGHSYSSKRNGRSRNKLSACCYTCK